MVSGDMKCATQGCKHKRNKAEGSIYCRCCRLDDGYCEESITDAVNKARLDFLYEFKELIQFAIDEALDRNRGIYDEWAESTAYEIIRNTMLRRLNEQKRSENGNNKH